MRVDCVRQLSITVPQCENVENLNQRSQIWLWIKHFFFQIVKKESIRVISFYYQYDTVNNNEIYIYVDLD